ncbi:MAG: hypothetical protein ABI758_02000 [Candidatus Woesebacteria bacterium]
MHDLKKRKEIEEKRLQGTSAVELAKLYAVPRGTVYYWVRNIILSDDAKRKLMNNTIEGRRLGRLTLKKRRDKENELIKVKANLSLKSLSVDISSIKIFCALLYWAQGAKKSSSMRFINSDPLMIHTFLTLLRKGFEINDSKFKVNVHIHHYHDDEKVKEYWSKITGIPLSQFNRSYRKLNAGLSKKEGYMGCITIYYYDVKIAKELTWLYTTLHTMI